MRCPWAQCGTAFVALLFVFAVNARPAVFWATPSGIPADQGVRSKTISVCFVGDAVTSRKDRVEQVMEYLKQFEYAANIQFNFLGACPAPQKQPDGTDFYAGDIRVVLHNIKGTKVAGWPGEEGTGPVPGQGCPMFIQNGKYCDSKCNPNSNNDGWGSWSNAPWDLPLNRSCQYNLKLGDDPWTGTPYLNHTLHEFGHALGLAHEHERNDVDYAHCSAANYGGGTSTGLMTPYDRNSVMHYQFLACGINGNYDRNGFSAADRLALHILYPEDQRVAEFVGTTVLRAGETLNLQSAWKARGANMSFVAQSFSWKLAGAAVGNSPDLNVNLATAGTRDLEYTHKDFLGRTYTYTGSVRVLSPAAFNSQIAGPVAAQLPILH